MGEFIYTSPNESFIPCPILGYRRVAVCEDYWFGPDDHTLWTQPYSDTFPHLAAIPRRPTDPNDPLEVMWYNPVDSDFTLVERGGIALGLGRLSTTLLDQRFRPLLEAMQARFTRYITSLSVDSSHRRFTSNIERAMQYTFTRLQSLPTTWQNVRFTVAELQCYYLELVGLLDYMELYKPRMDGSQSPSLTVARTLGCFTANPRIIEEFTSAGLPVWFIRPLKPGFANNVLEIVEPLSYDDHVITKLHDSFPVLHISSSHISTGDVIGLIHQFSRKWFSTPDPFQESSPSSSSSSSSMPPPSAPSSSSAVASMKPSQKRAKLSHTQSGASSSGKFTCTCFYALAHRQCSIKESTAATLAK